MELLTVLPTTSVDKFTIFGQKLFLTPGGKNDDTPRHYPVTWLM
nr:MULTISPECIES: hypothetical protein [unclassified Erwinia]